MAIEVTSEADPRSFFSLSRIVDCFQNIFHETPGSRQKIPFRFLAGVLAVAVVASADSLLRSYKYYSRIIDARLASGYLTSRPGLYAAPRSIRVGDRLSRERLVRALRCAGYVQSEASDVWSGSFSENAAGIEIRPRQINKREPNLIHVGLADGKISELTEDGSSVDYFTLQPEVLSNDLSAKTGVRETLTYSEIPPVLVHAILAIEDRRFFNHSGLDLFGVARALIRNADNDHIGQGGSTITQQLVKNTYLSAERTFRRKYAEAMLAFALERRLTKEDILALYCNEVYLGQRGAIAARGVREASQIYYSKKLKDLSLAQAATIAGMIQGPTRYSPLQHRDEAQARRNIVLEAMVRDGWISQQEATAAMKEEVALSPGPNSNNSIAPYFVDYVNRISESEFDASGASRRVFTTIDLELQQLAEAAVKDQLDRLDAVYKRRRVKPQAALVALDPQTGNVLAMVGGRDYAESQLNRATDARRQPGSAFKPFVYAAALEDGMSPVQMFQDAPREFVYDRNKTYRPANFGGGYSMREVTMRSALVKSLNVVTVDVALQTGLARIANLAERFGLPRPERYPSLALGTEEVTPLELAAAYATFVNGGRRIAPKVIASLGEPPAAHSLENNLSDAQVIQPTTAYMITNMLSAAVDHGTARAARDAVKGSAIAGKTGTSRDGWFVGYTPNLVCVVWIGFDDNEQLGLTGAEAALPGWVDFMKGAVELRPELGGRTFECPEGIKFVEIDTNTGLLSTLSCPDRELIAVTERVAPNLECYLHGNLPYQANRIEENAVELEQPDFVTHHCQVSITGRQKNRPSSFPAVTVDVDRRGRRTLTNVMR